MRGGGRPRRSLHGAWAARAAVAVVIAATLVAACAGTTSPAPTGVPLSTPVPAGTGSPGATANGPKPTTWPTNTLASAIALAAANDSFKTMSDDVANAVNAQDPRQMLTVMTDALTFLKANRSRIQYLQSYPETRGVGDQLDAAYGQLITGGQQVVDGLRTGDGKAVQAGFSTWFAGGDAYAAVLPALGDLASQAVLMQKNYLQ